MIRLVIKGCLLVEDLIDGGQEQLGPGSLLVHPPRSAYRNQVEGTGSVSLFMVAVEGRAFADRWHHLFGAGPWAAPSIDADEVMHLMRAMLARAAQSDQGVQQSCQSILDLIVDHCRRSQQGHITHSRQQDVLRGLEQHLEQQFSMAAFAERQGLDRSTLHRWCLQTHGCSPSAYRQQCRLKAAARWLQETDQTMSEIAQQVGFNCPFAFSKAFKRFFWHSSKSRSSAGVISNIASLIGRHG